MIEVLALAGMVTKVAGSISSAIKAGKDVNSIMAGVNKKANGGIISRFSAIARPQRFSGEF